MGPKELRSNIGAWVERSLNGRLIIRADLTIINDQFVDNNNNGMSIQGASKQKLMKDLQQLLTNSANW
jgi:hypothetical protein